MGELQDTFGGIGQGACTFEKWWIRGKEINYF